MRLQPVRLSWVVALVTAALATLAGVVTSAGAQTPVRLEIAVDPAVTETDWLTAFISAPFDHGLTIASATLPPPPPPPKSKAKPAPAPVAMSAFKAVRQGKVALAALPLTSLAGFSSLYAVDQIPFVGGKDASGPRLLLDTARPFLEQRLCEDGLILLAVVPSAPVLLVLKEPPADTLVGYSLPGYSAAELRATELAGMRSVRGFHQRLRTNAFFSSTFDAPARVWDGIPATVISYPAWHPFVILAANAAAWQKLGPEQRAAIQRWATAAENTTRPSPPVFQPMPDAVAAILDRVGWQMADEWAVATGADGAAIIAAVRAKRINP